MAKTFDELDTWQLANQLKRGVYILTESGSVTRDFDFYNDLRGSAKSAPSNIAEGFARYAPPQFRHFLDIAIGSLTETANHLRDGVDRKHFTESEIAPLLILVARARGAAIALKASLKNAKPPEPNRGRRSNKPPNRRT